MLFFYVLIAIIGAVASFYMRWMAVFCLSLALAAAALVALFNEDPGAVWHVGVGIVVLQLSYFLTGLSVEYWRDARASRAGSIAGSRKVDRPERNYRKAPHRLQAW